MICTRVVPFLSSGLAKNNKLMSIFVLFSRLFGHFESLAFFSKMGNKPYTKPVKHDVLVNFSKIKQVAIFQKARVFWLNSRDKLIADANRRLFNKETMFLFKKCDFLDCFLGTK